MNLFDACKKRTLFILLYLFPAIASFILLIFLRSSFRYADFLENSLFSLLFILLSLLINNRKSKVIFLCSGFILITIIIFCETAYYYLYGYSISESTLSILLETYRAEASEYLSTFVDLNILLLILVFFAPVCFICKFITRSIKNLITDHTKKIKYRNLTIPALMLAIISIIVFTKLKNYNLPLTTLKSLIDYQNTVKKLDKLVQKKDGGNFSNVYVTDTDEKAVYIVVIGESTTNHHFNLYGYYRQTNPLLNEIKDELYVYKNVIAPHTTTIQVLLKALTPGNYEAPEKSTTGTLLQLMNKAGFKTYWISNQKPEGTKESITAKLSKTADERIFLSNRNKETTPPFDEELLLPLQKVLKEDVNKKMIFIHLLGAHTDYAKRYPKTFEHFKDTPKTLFKSELAFKIINEYDNAILYNDFVIRNIIDLVRKTSSKSFVLYFSDHGEDVYETGNIAWHKETEGTRPMYDIPFIVWLSDEYKRNIAENLVFDINRKYMTDDLIYSIAGLSDVKFDEFDLKRSLFDKGFEFRKRRIYNNLDYDLLFSKQNN
jgi:heptose-I-phosphate ethanolaminephosphotransferase